MTKIVSSKTLFQDQYIQLVENTIEFKGNTRQHNDVYRKPAVSIFPIDDSGNIFLINQYRYLLGETVIEAVAGIMDEGEEILDTARRELREETGIVAHDYRKIHSIYAAGSFVKIQQHLVVARNLSFETATPEEDEQIKLIKMPLVEAVEKVLAGEIKTASSIIGILLLDKMRQRGQI